MIGSGGSGGTKPAGPGPQEIDKCASGVEVTMVPFISIGVFSRVTVGSDLPLVCVSLVYASGAKPG